MSDDIRVELLEALKKAVDLIISEYCSHRDAHSPDNPSCYVKEFLQVIRKAESQEVHHD